MDTVFVKKTPRLFFLQATSCSHSHFPLPSANRKDCSKFGSIIMDFIHISGSACDNVAPFFLRWSWWWWASSICSYPCRIIHMDECMLCCYHTINMSQHQGNTAITCFYIAWKEKGEKVSHVSFFRDDDDDDEGGIMVVWLAGDS